MILLNVPILVVLSANDGRKPGRATIMISTATVAITSAWLLFPTMHSLLRAWVENYSQHEHETIQDLCKSQQPAECPSVSEKYVTHT
jgi:hypothetical protein